MNDTTEPPTYAVEEFHAGAVHEPGGVVVGGVVGGLVGGVAPANRTLNLVNSHGVCGTLLHEPEVVPLLSGGLHCRSRLTDQKVNRLSPWLVA